MLTLAAMGFANAGGVAAAIRAWHHGRYRAMRSERARELLTALTPRLLEALAATAEPDAAFRRFDAFLAALPAGVMLLALLTENPQFLGLLGRIMGMAPGLAEPLAQNPALLDELLTADFFGPLPDEDALSEDLDRALALARHYEDALIRLRRWTAGRKFQAGVHILESISDGMAAGRFLTAIAETALTRLLPLVEAEFAARHGTVPGGAFAIVAFGRLGSGMMSFASDLDIVTIYDAPDGAVSDGQKPLDAPLYFTRLTQRLVAAITAPMAEGRLYEVDLRLRPSGASGPVAASLDAFRRYYAESAWTWEHMALTRARPIAGDTALRERIVEAIAETLTAPREPAKLVTDVAQMRRRIAEQHKPRNRWDLKYTEGGLIDVEFVVQYLLLRHAHDRPDLLATETTAAISRLVTHGLLAQPAAADLTRALTLAWDLQGLLRLISRESPDVDAAPAAIKTRLAAEIARATAADLARIDFARIDFAGAETILDRILAASHRRYDEIVGKAVAPETDQPDTDQKESTR
jgi:glutamate-ammonia-ligase adenylyltransferase